MTTIKALKKFPHFKFVRIPAGTFMMGEANPKNPVTQPLHLVTLKAFEMCAYPVTQGIWEQVMGSGIIGSGIPDDGPDFPVRSVVWSQIQEFISRLNMTDPKHTYRLPTEAEWEYVAKEGHTADGNPDSFAWHFQISDGRTHIVGQKAPNTLGLYDMLGNVWEYCQDIYQDSYIGAAKDGSARETPLNYSFRVTRGGSFMTGFHSIKVTERGYANANKAWSSMGFRLVRTAKAKTIKSPVKPPSVVKGHPHQKTLTKTVEGTQGDTTNQPPTKDFQAEALQRIGNMQFTVQWVRDALPKLTQDIEALVAEIRSWKTEQTPIENFENPLLVTDSVLDGVFDILLKPPAPPTLAYSSRKGARDAQKKSEDPKSMRVTRHPTMPYLWALVPRTPKKADRKATLLIKERILKTLEEHPDEAFHVKEFWGYLTMPDGHFEAILKELLEEGRITEVGPNRYQFKKAIKETIA